MTDNTEALPPLPEKRWAGFCGKCNSVTKFQERPNTKAAPCGRCGYATFCEELDYSDDEMRDYARAALAQRQQVPSTHHWCTFCKGNNVEWCPMNNALASAPALTAAPSAQAEPRHCPACGYELPAPPTAQAEPQEPLPEFLTAQDKADLLRIEDCFSDGEGYDLPRERMARLAELGVIRHNGGGVYSITAFGMYCAGAWPVLPLKTAAESNDEAMRLHLERVRGIGKQESK